MWKTPQEIEERLERILPGVQKPGRYAGGELNQIVKDWESIATHVALVFPDIYDLGLPNLGMAILYDALNQRPDTLAERAYLPWLDMEEAMRADGVPLYALESKHPLADFDLIGFSLPYETLYTNVLNALDLAGLPLHSSDRDERHPLIIAGGHAAYNPEPMSAFIDAFVIGEGEEVIHEVVDCHQRWRASGAGRAELLYALAQIPGVYVPTLYQVSYQDDGTIAAVQPTRPDLPKQVLKRVVAELPPPLTRFLVPNIDVVQNRIALEIMRGCTRGCRFCHAGMIMRPVRERPVEQIITAIEEALANTGHEEIALLSLSSSDYTQIAELTRRISEQFGRRHLSVTVPSLRIESFSVKLMENLQHLHASGGFTLAPEAATDRMRSIINKPVSTDQLMDTAQEVFSHGWTSIKLYFMIGHPEETLEDVQAIADLCRAVMALGKRIVGGRVKVHAGIGTFIPKPHTPFQWVSCDSIEQIRQKQDLLRRELRHPNIKMTWTDPQTTLLEAWLARGDRRMSEVIFRAWQSGCKFDAWQDQYCYEKWAQAFADSGIDPLFYSHRVRALDEIFPWEHINPGVQRSYLQEEYLASKNGTLREDCREHCYACGILPAFSDLRMNTAANAWKCPPVRKPGSLKEAA